MAEKSCKKLTNIFISCVVNLCIFHFSNQALPLLPHSFISKCVLNTVLCAWNSVVIIIMFNSAPATGGGDGDYSGCCYMTMWMLNFESLLCHCLIFLVGCLTRLPRMVLLQLPGSRAVTLEWVYLVQSETLLRSIGCL